MYKFKVGDKVRFKDGHTWDRSGFVEFTIKTIVGDVFTIEEAYFTSRTALIELVLPERQALSDAMDLCAKYEVRVGEPVYDQGVEQQYWHASRKGMGRYTKESVLDVVFPAKTPEQLEIEEVEGKLRVLADQLKELKER